MCDKNPASADFYGSNMRGKLTDASPCTPPPRLYTTSKARADRVASFSLLGTENIDPTVHSRGHFYCRKIYTFDHDGSNSALALWVLPRSCCPLAYLINQPTLYQCLRKSPLELGPHKKPPLLPLPQALRTAKYVATLNESAAAIYLQGVGCLTA